MEIAKIIYSGSLRTVATHLASGTTIQTDAPVDNQGKGETFSPTDLLATSLGSCMLTIMGIQAAKHKFSFENAEVRISKFMGTAPRRVVKIGVFLKIERKGLSNEQLTVLEEAAMSCPVAMSLHPDIEQDVTFEYF